MSEHEPAKVAIIGSGCAAMSAAFELTRPEHKGKYQVTVYQLGWRLGGKGASGRNREKNDRIEEHGLHIWMGFYENGFSAMRGAYTDLARTKIPPPRLALATPLRATERRPLPTPRSKP